MKIAIASDGNSENSEISQRGGRAPYYLVFVDGKITEKIRNPFAMGGGGAGFSVAYMLANKQVQLVIAGELGDNMKDALQEKGIRYEEKNGKVKDML